MDLFCCSELSTYIYGSICPLTRKTTYHMFFVSETCFHHKSDARVFLQAHFERGKLSLQACYATVLVKNAIHYYTVRSKIPMHCEKWEKSMLFPYDGKNAFAGLSKKRPQWKAAVHWDDKNSRRLNFSFPSNMSFLFGWKIEVASLFGTLLGNQV